MNKNKIFRTFIIGAILVIIGVLTIWIEKIILVGIFCLVGLFLMIFSLNEIEGKHITRRLLKSFNILCKFILFIIAFIYANELFFDPQLTIEPYNISYPAKADEKHLLAELNVKVRKKAPFPAKAIFPEIYIEYGDKRPFLSNWYMENDQFPFNMGWGWREEEKTIKVRFTPRSDELPEKTGEDIKIIITAQYKTWLMIRDMSTFRQYKFIPNVPEGGQKEFTRIK